MIVPIAAGALAGLGLWCLLRAYLTQVTVLDDALAAVGQRRMATDNVSGLDSASHRLGTRIMRATGGDLGSFSADLAVLDRSEEVHLVQRIRTAAVYALMPVSIWLVALLAAGTQVVHPVFLLVIAIGAAVGGWVLTDSQVRSRAREQRRDFDAALVTYISLVSILMAGGAGVQQALHDAVGQGQGWSFLVLRRALTDARVRGVSPWVSFDEHGQRLGLQGLIDLAATMELAGTSGAQVRRSLNTKARASRIHQLAEIEREASSRTSAMVGPTGLMLAGFPVLVIYPAFQVVLAL
jgi:Flp pilus assembly protein TadB